MVKRLHFGHQFVRCLAFMLVSMHSVAGQIETPDVPDDYVCQWGCWDEEDEACHAGLTQNGCAEIYGHVTWAQVCECGLNDTVAEPKVEEQNGGPASSRGRATSSLPLPIILALVLSRLVGCCFFQGTKGMKVDNFMKASSVFLLFICAGFFSCSMHALQELEVFGTWSPKSERPWANQKVWDASDCCSDKTNRFFVLMRALLGWQDQPTPVELFAYFLYWLVAICLGYVIVKKIKKDMDARVAEWRRQDAEAVLTNAVGAASESEKSQPNNAEPNDGPLIENDEKWTSIVVVR